MGLLPPAGAELQYIITCMEHLDPNRQVCLFILMSMCFLCTRTHIHTNKQTHRYLVGQSSMLLIKGEINVGNMSEFCRGCLLLTKTNFLIKSNPPTSKGVMCLVTDEHGSSLIPFHMGPGRPCPTLLHATGTYLNVWLV